MYLHIRFCDRLLMQYSNRYFFHTQTLPRDHNFYHSTSCGLISILCSFRYRLGYWGYDRIWYDYISKRVYREVLSTFRLTDHLHVKKYLKFNICLIKLTTFELFCKYDKLECILAQQVVCFIDIKTDMIYIFHPFKINDSYFAFHFGRKTIFLDY